jgi:hypothetical protein
MHQMTRSPIRAAFVSLCTAAPGRVHGGASAVHGSAGARYTNAGGASAVHGGVDAGYTNAGGPGPRGFTGQMSVTTPPSTT